MATFGGPALNDKYLTNLVRILDDGGSFIRPDAKEIRTQLDEIISLNPSLLLTSTFSKVGKLYSTIPEDGTGDFTVSRNGTATHFDKDGLLKTAAINEPRLNFDPISGSFKGVLVEPAAANLLTYSEDVNEWSLFNATLESTLDLSPDGIQTVSKLVENTGSLEHSIQPKTTPITQGTNYTFTIFVKPNGRDYIQIQRNNSQAFFLYLAGFYLNGEGRIDLRDAVSASIQALPNNWYKCTVTATALNNYGSGTMRIYLSDQTLFRTPPYYTGDGVSGVYIWGAQLEEGAVATSYIPTSGSQVTRPADIITRTNVQDLIGQTEGTIYLSGIYRFNNEIEGILGIFGNNNNYITLRSWNVEGWFVIRVFVSGILQFNSAFSTTLTNGDYFKLVIKYSNGDYKVYVNGILELLQNNYSTNFTELNDINIGIGLPNTNPTKQHYKNLSLFKTPLTDQQAIALTTI